MEEGGGGPHVSYLPISILLFLIFYVYERHRFWLRQKYLYKDVDMYGTSIVIMRRQGLWK